MMLPDLTAHPKELVLEMEVLLKMEVPLLLDMEIKVHKAQASQRDREALEALASLALGQVARSGVQVPYQWRQPLTATSTQILSVLDTIESGCSGGA
jgi:hypothetical protein